MEHSKNRKVAFVDDYRYCIYNIMFLKLHVTVIEHLPYFRYCLCHMQNTLHTLLRIFLLTSLLHVNITIYIYKWMQLRLRKVKCFV